MFHRQEKRIQEAFEAHIAARYGVQVPVVIEQPKQSEYGEVAVPAAFHLAKQLRQAPKKIAAELVGEIGAIEGVATLEVAGNGYINARIDRGAKPWLIAADEGAPAHLADSAGLGWPVLPPQNQGE